MAYPAAYLHHEQAFLQDVFNRHAGIKAAFDSCAKIFPMDRIAVLRETMTCHPRRIWHDIGIPVASCETLADHAGRMALLAYRHPVREHDPQMVRDMIDVWALPLTIADEIPLDVMNRKDRHTLRDLAARLVFNDYTQRDAWQTWNNLAEQVYEESGWVNDLDHIATACQAREYKSDFPHLSGDLDGIIHCCRNSLLTKEGKQVFASIFSPAPVTARPRLAA